MAATAGTWAGVAAEETPHGSTIRNTAAARRIATVPLLTGLGVRLEVTPSLIVKLGRGNNSVGKETHWPVVDPIRVSRTGHVAELDPAIERQGDQTALEVVTSRAAARATEMPSEGDQGDQPGTTDPAHGQTVSAARPAWDRVVVASEAEVRVVEDGADSE